MTTKTKARPTRLRVPAKKGLSRRASKRETKTILEPKNWQSRNGSDGGGVPPESDVGFAAICSQLQAIQRRRAATLKARNAIDNNLGAMVAQQLGYSSGLEQADRAKFRPLAGKIIKAVQSGEPVTAEHQCVVDATGSLIIAVGASREPFQVMLDECESAMKKLAAKLPAAAWVAEPDRRGFGLLFLAIIVGECGDLSNYANPGKLWKRMGCAPFNGKMPRTWRMEGGLSAEDWTTIGYSPRRRSIMFLVGENIVKQNFLKVDVPERETESTGVDQCSDGSTYDHESQCVAAENNGVVLGSDHATTHDASGGDGNYPETEACAVAAAKHPGPYRAHYDLKKAEAVVRHPDWTPGHLHWHAMLVASKRLLRDLWIEWRKK